MMEQAFCAANLGCDWPAPDTVSVPQVLVKGLADTRLLPPAESSLDKQETSNNSGVGPIKLPYVRSNTPFNFVSMPQVHSDIF